MAAPKRPQLPESPTEPVALPADDPKPDRRAEQLREAQDAYGYTYSKPNLRGLAMCAELTRLEKPTATWLVEAVRVAGGLLLNAAGQKTAGIKESDLGQAMATAGRRAPEVLIERVTHYSGVASSQRVGQMGDFARMFQHFRVPDIAAEMYLDSHFARRRVAGANPAWFTQVNAHAGLPADFGVTNAHYQAAMGDDDSLDAALAEGRLYLSEYRELVDLAPGSHPVPPKIEIDYKTDPEGWDVAYAAREAAYATTGEPKVLAAPLALFAVPRGGQALAPVAIQLFPNGTHGGPHPVFTPRDGTAWLGAKTCVQMADGCVHEVISHFGLTHLVQEAFCLALHNCFAPRHPLHRLLKPHFQGTALINAAADASLVSPAGGVDQLLGSTIGGSIKIAANARNAWDFNASMFPRDLERRGVADAEALPDYPYRDDGLLIWNALETWVGAYVGHYYATDAAVQGDVELQAFVLQASQYQATDARGRVVGGGIKGIGEDGPCVLTRDYLVQMLTQIIWNGSAQHAAVNFPQGDQMIYPPAYPLYMAGPGPTSVQGFTDADYLQQMPHDDYARTQVNTAALLGGLHDSKLGQYGRRGPAPWFGEQAVRDHLEVFQDELARIEQIIDDRNQSRPRYSYLKPSQIPQSIDI